MSIFIISKLLSNDNFPKMLNHASHRCSNEHEKDFILFIRPDRYCDWFKRCIRNIEMNVQIGKGSQLNF